MTELNISHVLADKVPIYVINIIMEFVSELNNSQWKPMFLDDNKMYEMIWKVNKFNKKNNCILNSIQLKKKNTNKVELYLPNINFESVIKDVLMTDILDFQSIIGNNKLYKQTYYLQYFHHGYQESLYLTFERIEKDNDGVKEFYCNSSGIIFRPYLQEKYRCEDISDWILMNGRLFIYKFNAPDEFTGNWEYNLELNIWEYIINIADENEEIIGVEGEGINAIGEELN
jgi:hypothetical protein